MSHLMFCCISRNVVKWGPHGVDYGKSRVSTQNQVFHAWHSKYPGFCPKTWVSVKYHENHVQLHHSHVYWHKILREWTMTDQKKPKGSDFATEDPRNALFTCNWACALSERRAMLFCGLAMNFACVSDCVFCDWPPVNSIKFGGVAAELITCLLKYIFWRSGHMYTLPNKESAILECLITLVAFWSDFSWEYRVQTEHLYFTNWKPIIFPYNP